MTRSGNGYGPNPITLSEIRAYIELLGPVVLPVDVFVDLLVQTDQKYMELESNKLKRKADPKGGRAN